MQKNLEHTKLRIKIQTEKMEKVKHGTSEKRVVLLANKELLIHQYPITLLINIFSNVCPIKILQFFSLKGLVAYDFSLNLKYTVL